MVIKFQNGVVSNEYAEGRKLTQSEKEKSSKMQNGSVYGGNLKQTLDPVMEKKEQAQKKAMKLWMDAVSAEQNIDMDLETRTDHMQQLRELKDECSAKINELSKQQEALKEEYGITDDCQEQQLNSEYQERYLELESIKGEYQRQLKEANDEYLAESSIIEGIKTGRVKSHTLGDAGKKKDEMMIEASKEAANMLMDEVKDKIDKEQEELEEKAEKKAEKEEAEEERLEAIREKTKEDEYADDEDELFDALRSEGAIRLENTKDEIKQEVKKMVNEMKLLVEDLKGAAVDEQL